MFLISRFNVQYESLSVAVVPKTVLLQLFLNSEGADAAAVWGKNVKFMWNIGKMQPPSSAIMRQNIQN